MKKKKITACRAVSALAAVVVASGAVCPAGTQFAPLNANAGQQLGQTDFENGVGLPWHIVESAPGEMDFKIEKGAYTVTIVNPGGASRGGEDRWDCQFRHRGLKIVSGHKYKVSYEITPSESGKYYTKIGNLDGDVEIWHNMMADGGPDFNSTWDCIQIGKNETKKVDVTFTADKSLDVAEWAFHLGGDGQYTNGDCFPVGTEIKFDNMSLIDLTGDENDYPTPEVWERADILTNQVCYFPKRAKKATLLSDSSKPVDFEVIDESGKTVYEGKSTPFGHDKDSDDEVHIIDFTDLDKEGTYHIETKDGSESRDFEICGSETYSSLLYDSLNYFYQNRSGIEIESDFISSGETSELARAAGHPKDMAEIEQTWGYSGSSGSIDVTGGWYDAGDHGKYVVNGGFSLWLMQNQYETALKYGFEDAYGDGTMLLPENTNGTPDLLDEARWEMEWMLKMIVESGEYKGMAYHKAHDEKWTALGIAPADDDMKRIVKPPTTAATLNLAACGAQAARLWKDYDSDFAEQCLTAAKNAFEAAKKHPDMYAPLDESIGGGAYGDTDVEDEFCWAALELFITTGDEDYYDEATENKFFLDVPQTLGGGESVDTVGSFDWGNTGGLATLSAALNTDKFDKGDAEIIQEAIVSAADNFISLEENQGYGVPYGQSKLSYNDSDEGYIWGSNSFVTDNAIVMAYAYLLTNDESYLDGAIGGMDYILGRNAMDYSYVTGYGTHAIEYPHHRYWARQIDESFPKAPNGVMCGGPNSGMQDPWVQGSGWKKGEIPPQKCYLDNIEAWSVNECTINWNASLAWLAGFTAQEATDEGIVVTPHTNGKKSDKEEATTTKSKKTKTEKTTAKTTKAKKTDDDKDDDKNSGGLLKVGLIAGAAVIALISLELFIYKMAKLKKNDK
ncbi:glycoside hydrolase family 9 protein [Ruminococcus flavefaciens]|uniref:Endoglucanase n=1 Tax=Ruminococcus flavefaciens TaxID=1265 RepID=A0A1K1Q3Y7_RUMFL|nr:glycoside hydrolase family 9 protein [Ruminococcus flavefaciens]SFW54453.1 Carbohydrate binding domain-containing protein [Ruminococcus flavefaciens]